MQHVFDDLPVDLWRVWQQSREMYLFLSTIRATAEYYPEKEGEAACQKMPDLLAELPTALSKFRKDVSAVEMELLVAAPGVPSKIRRLVDDAKWLLMFTGISEVVTPRRWPALRSHIIARLPSLHMEVMDAAGRSIDAEIAVVWQRRLAAEKVGPDASAGRSPNGEPPGEQPKFGFLGIRLDEANRKVGRVGFDKVIELGAAELEWHVFHRCYSANGERVRTDVMRENYPGEFAQQAGVVVRLNKKLKRLNLKIAFSKLTETTPGNVTRKPGKKGQTLRRNKVRASSQRKV